MSINESKYMTLGVASALVGAAVVGMRAYLSARFSEDCQETSMADIPELMRNAGVIIGASTSLAMFLDDELEKNKIISTEYKGYLTKAISFLASRGVYAYCMSASEVDKCLETSWSYKL